MQPLSRFLFSMAMVSSLWAADTERKNFWEAGSTIAAIGNPADCVYPESSDVDIKQNTGAIKAFYAILSEIVVPSKLPSSRSMVSNVRLVAGQNKAPNRAYVRLRVGNVDVLITQTGGYGGRSLIYMSFQTPVDATEEGVKTIAQEWFTKAALRCESIRVKSKTDQAFHVHGVIEELDSYNVWAKGNQVCFEFPIFKPDDGLPPRRAMPYKWFEKDKDAFEGYRLKDVPAFMAKTRRLATRKNRKVPEETGLAQQIEDILSAEAEYERPEARINALKALSTAKLTPTEKQKVAMLMAYLSQYETAKSVREVCMAKVGEIVKQLPTRPIKEETEDQKKARMAKMRNAVSGLIKAAKANPDSAVYEKHHKAICSLLPEGSAMLGSVITKNPLEEPVLEALTECLRFHGDPRAVRSLGEMVIEGKTDDERRLYANALAYIIKNARLESSE